MVYTGIEQPKLHIRNDVLILISSSIALFSYLHVKYDDLVNTYQTTYFNAKYKYNLYIM